MRADRNQALKLRLSGKSYTEINRLLGIPKSTLSGWLSGVILSSAVQEQMQSRVNRISHEAILRHNALQTKIAHKRQGENIATGRLLVPSIEKNELSVLGATLYWAEGYKRQRMLRGKSIVSHPVSLTNADPRIIKVFIKYLKEIHKVQDEKIRIHIRLFPHQNSGEVIAYWKQVTRLTDQNFLKPTVTVSRSSVGKRPYNRLLYGVAQVVVYDTALFHKIMGAIEALGELV